MNIKDLIKLILVSIKEDENYELIKDIIGARVFYNNISLNIEKKKEDSLWYRFESEKFRNNNYNREVVKELYHYTSTKYNEYNIWKLGYILKDKMIISGVYYNFDKDEIIFIKYINKVIEDEKISLIDFIEKSDVLLKIDNKFYNDFIKDIISRIVFGYFNYNRHIEFLNKLFINYSNLTKNTGLELAKLYCKQNDFSFIVGAGVNKDLSNNLCNDTGLLPDSLSKASWYDLVYLINKGIISHFNTSSLLIQDVEEFNQGMSNINYFSPQMMKMLDEKKYDNIISNFLYGDNNKSMFVNRLLKEKYNPDIKNTYLYKIAKYMSKNPNSKILSFNYDDYFDRIYKYSVGTECKNTVNPHGFIQDKRIYAVSKPDSAIVLSSFEYMNGYSEWDSRARKITREHLDNANVIVGNSLSDYEEQKVFKMKYLKNRSYRSFLIAKELKSGELNFMKDLYFRSIGVYYCPVKDYSDIGKFLDDINK